MMTNDGIDFKQRVPLHRHFKMEVRLRLNCTCVDCTAMASMCNCIALIAFENSRAPQLAFIIVLGKL